MQKITTQFSDQQTSPPRPSSSLLHCITFEKWKSQNAHTKKAWENIVLSVCWSRSNTRRCETFAPNRKFPSVRWLWYTYVCNMKDSRDQPSSCVVYLFFLSFAVLRVSSFVMKKHPGFVSAFSFASFAHFLHYSEQMALHLSPVSFLIVVCKLQLSLRKHVFPRRFWSTFG